MKIREGFVSNSSTSSFICDICKGLHYVMDGDIFSDCRLTECSHHHIFCVDHIDIEFFKNKAKLMIAKEEAYKIFEDKIDSIENWEQMHEMWSSLTEKKEIYTGVVADFLFNLKDQLPSHICPICSNMEIAGCDILDYLEANPDFKKEIIQKIKKEYASYDDLRKGLESVRQTRETREDELKFGSW